MACLFSILIPTYNRRDLLRQTIESVLAQTYKDFEVIVVDDGSTDGTPASLAAFGDRVAVRVQRNQGPEAARREAARLATGEYLVLLDNDDLLLPWALETYDRVIRECGPPAVLLGALDYFTDRQPPEWPGPLPKEIQVLQYRDYLSKDVPVGLSSSNIVIRRSVFLRGGAMTAAATFPFDTQNYLLVFGTASPCVLVREPKTVAYRLHAGNTVRNIELMVGGCLNLLATERRGRYPGGRERRVDRYVFLGGAALSWGTRAIQHGRRRLGFDLLLTATPMLLAGGWRRLTRRFRPPTPTLRLAFGTRCPTNHMERPT